MASVVDVVSMATARLCKVKTFHASVFATHDLTVDQLPETGNACQ
jgi:hypothetical protein